MQFLRTGWLTLCAGLVLCASPAAAALLPGIDVSNYQGTINWTAVKNGGTAFAYVKATEGTDFVDARFTQNMAGGAAAGVLVGPYHFARINSFVSDPLDAANEANDFVDAIAPYYATQGKYLRPVIDVETLPGLSSTSANKVYLSEWVRDFAAVVVSRLGIQPVIYANVNYVTTYMESNLSQYDLWLAKWTYNTSTQPTTANTGAWGNWDLWQWSDNTTVAGISGAVDGDVFNGSLADFKRQFVVQQPGDFNVDGVVDAEDFTRYRDGLGGDYLVGDLQTWRTNFGDVWGAAALAATTSVPEPVPPAILLGSLAALAAGYRRRCP